MNSLPQEHERLLEELDSVPAAHRDAILSYAYRFLPETRHKKNEALDGLLLQVIRRLQKTSVRGATLEQIQDQVTSSTRKGLALTGHEDLLDSLRRLLEDGKTSVLALDAVDHFVVSAETLRELDTEAEAFAALLNRTVKRVFISETSYDAKAAFLDVLSRFFSLKTLDYAQMLLGTSRYDVSTSSELRQVINVVIEKHKIGTWKLEFSRAVRTFFVTFDPEYDRIKWAMARNYYVLICLGLGGADTLFSSEYFGSKQIILDTNVIIDLVEPKRPRHAGVVRVLDNHRTSGGAILVAEASIDEMNHLVAAQIMKIESVKDQIPETLNSEIDDVFWKLYLEFRELGDSVYDIAFQNFYEARDILAKYDAGYISRDETFELTQSGSFEVLKRYVETAYNKIHKFSAGKAKAAIEHDAAIILWAHKKAAHNAVVLTLDNSLTDSYLSYTKGKPLVEVITLEALLSWYSVFADDNQYEFADVYASMLAEELLPQAELFRLEDFAIFADLQLQCKSMPALRVVECMQYIKSNYARVDMRNPRNRERVAYDVRRFFASEQIKDVMQSHDDRAELIELRNKVHAFQEEDRIRTENQQLEEVQKQQVLSRWKVLGVCVVLVLVLLFAGVGDYVYAYKESALVPSVGDFLSVRAQVLTLYFLVWLALATFVLRYMRLHELGRFAE